MSLEDNFIYSEKDRRQIEGPFTVQPCKWYRSLKKRATWLRRLFFSPDGRMRERIVEYPLVLAVMSTLQTGSRIADLGGASGLLGLQMVYLGHEVHVLDLRPYPLQHPRLISKQIDVFDNDLPDNYFHAISCISVIEHAGITRYGGRRRPDGDLVLMKEIHRLCRPLGLVVISAPYGQGHDPELDGWPSSYRIYNRDRLEKLLTGFSDR